MNTGQIVLFVLFPVVFALMIWGRYRYDLVAFAALVVAALLGAVPADKVFDGFGHPATIIVAIVLVISRGLINSGAVDWISRVALDRSRSLGAHIATMAVVGGGLSAFMNNVAALALLMPVELSASAKSGRSPAATLMPLAFASILGGMITLIGTPPNIIIAAYRGDVLGEEFGMFAFTPVGLVCAIAGITFIATIGWRLIPSRHRDKAPSESLRDLHGYVAELTVTEKSDIVGKQLAELDDAAVEAGVSIIGLVRRGRRVPGSARREPIREGDMLVVDGPADGIDALVGALKVDVPGRDALEEDGGHDLALLEVVVPRYSRLDGRTAQSLNLQYHTGVALLGVSREGTRFRERVGRLSIRAGDLLLLIGPSERLAEAADWLGALPLADSGLELTQHGRAALAVGIFAAAVAAASFGLVQLPLALAAVVILYVVFDILPLRQIYASIEWPVVILLGSMIPLGVALEETGGTALIAGGIVGLAAGLPAWVVLVVLMAVVMTLSDVLNNTAVAVIGAPIAVEMAARLEVSPDPFLMAVAVAASCAFLTPIGHQNNTLILGPGGYAFGDYWRMGLPLEILIVAIGAPAILFFWPL
jgi:di/tricarboxylate transporter